MPPLVGKAKPPINVVGDVGGRIAIMVDDMIDDVKSFIDAAHILKERGAYKIYALATHGILSADAPRLIQESPIDEVRSKQCYQLFISLQNSNFAREPNVSIYPCTSGFVTTISVPFW